MRITRRAFQRIALAVIAVCLIALLGPRLVKADHDHVEVELGRAYGVAEGHAPTTHEASHSSGTSAHATQSRRNTRDEVYLDRSFSVGSGDMLAVELAAADLIVESGGSSTQARVVIRGDGRDAAEEFERRRFSAEYSRGTLHIRSNPEQRRRRDNVRAGFTVMVTVPSRMNANLTLASGDVRVGDLVGSFELTTASGDIELGSVQGPSISLAAASGDISAQRLDGPVSISTASGDIDIQHILGSSVDLSAASGDITVHTLEADHLEATSASGDVHVGRLFGQSEVTTTSGDISVYLSDAADISTTSGSVSLQLPRGAGFDVELQSPDIDIDRSLNFQGSRERRSVRGSIGPGGARLEISTTSGSIELDTE